MKQAKQTKPVYGTQYWGKAENGSFILWVNHCIRYWLQRVIFPSENQNLRNMMWKQEPSLGNVCAKQNNHPIQQLKKQAIYGIAETSVKVWGSYKEIKEIKGTTLPCVNRGSERKPSDVFQHSIRHLAVLQNATSVPKEGWCFFVLHPQSSQPEFCRDH